jgi:hypothetical protein
MGTLYCTHTLYSHTVLTHCTHTLHSHTLLHSLLHSYSVGEIDRHSVGKMNMQMYSKMKKKGSHADVRKGSPQGRSDRLDSTAGERHALCCTHTLHARKITNTGGAC